MSLVREPFEWNRPERDRAAGSGTQFKIVREQVQELARGSFACPHCDLPVVLVSPVAIAAEIECPFCGSFEPARRYVRVDEIDTPRNQVQLRARLPA
jgi:hypothetical protein